MRLNSIRSFQLLYLLLESHQFDVSPILSYHKAKTGLSQHVQSQLEAKNTSSLCPIIETMTMMCSFFLILFKQQ